MSRTRSCLLLGLVTAVLTLAADQATKLYLLFGYDLPAHAPIRLGPFFDLVFTRNTGISYGLFQTEGTFGHLALVAFKVAAIIALLVWLTRTKDRLSAVSLGLIIGGALGNAIDRLAYGWVLDFVYFHIRTAEWQFNWYVFNLADVTIVVGVAGLLYDSLRGPAPQKRPDRA
jgi:signal peptidase II